MRVFVVQYHVDYESDTVIAVCSSFKKAKKARNADLYENGLGHIYNYSITEWEVDRKVRPFRG